MMVAYLHAIRDGNGNQQNDNVRLNSLINAYGRNDQALARTIIRGVDLNRELTQEVRDQALEAARIRLKVITTTTTYGKENQKMAYELLQSLRNADDLEGFKMYYPPVFNFLKEMGESPTPVRLK